MRPVSSGALKRSRRVELGTSARAEAGGSTGGDGTTDTAAGLVEAGRAEAGRAVADAGWLLLEADAELGLGGRQGAGGIVEGLASAMAGQPRSYSLLLLEV